MKEQGYTVWKLLGRHKPRRCPCCDQRKTLSYVGFAPNYEPGINAQMYYCNQCGAWLDCLWPKDYAIELQEKTIYATATL